MGTQRLSRFSRASSAKPFEITERDREIVRLVHKHRFLRSSHLTTLLGGSQQNILRRLQLLYHHGYLERPRIQIDAYHRPGSRHIIYGLGDEGESLLKRESANALRPVSWEEKNTAVGRVFFEHALLVSDVMVAIEIACRQRGIRLIADLELNLPNQGRPFRWKVNIGKRKLGVIPDQVFALEFARADGVLQRSYFFLEADRGTMPVKRHILHQTSFHRKFLAYEATWTQNVHRDFGFHRFRVLTVTTSPARVKSLIAECSQLESGQGLFLFADTSILSADILSFLWQTAKPGEAASLLD